MTWKVRFKFRVLRLYVHVRNMAAHGETAIGLTAPCHLPLICLRLQGACLPTRRWRSPQTPALSIPPFLVPRTLHGLGRVHTGDVVYS